MLIYAARGSLYIPDFLKFNFLWVLEHSETGVGEHSTSVAHLAHHIQATPTGKQKKSKKTPKYSESSGHHQLGYTLLLMVISISGDAYESILSFWIKFTCIRSLYRAVDCHMCPYAEKGVGLYRNTTHISVQYGTCTLELTI